MNVARFLAAALAICALGVPRAFAQDPETAAPVEPPKSRTIEEILVTAQRTEQQIRDVPISMSAFDGAFLRDQGVTDLQDVVRLVPNVRVDVAGSIIQPRIRGFSTNTVVNRGLELPVGIVIDEVPYSRGDYFQSGLFDLERIEVLRGPQGQLFGANTTVGLLNLTTRNPTDELSGFIDTELGELDSRRFEAGVGGPVVEGFLNARVAALWDERGDYVDNTTDAVVTGADRNFGDRERKSVRAKLDFPDLLGGTLRLSYQHDDQDIGPTPRELTNVPQKFRNLLLQYDPNTDFVPLNYVGSLNTPSFRQAKIHTVALKGHYDLADWGLDLVGGWSKLTSDSEDDSDSAPWHATRAVANETSEQFTGELRLTSPDLEGFFGLGQILGQALGSTDFTAGLFFQRRTQSPTNTRAELNFPLYLLTTAMSGLADAPLVIPRPPDLVEFFATEFEQTADQLSAFGQMNWRFTERWTLLYGMRFDYTMKDATWVQTLGPEPAILLPALVAAYTDEQSNDEFHFAPKVGAKFDWSDDLNFYATWSSNFQSGGFNNFSTSAADHTRRVDPARVRSWEAGSKWRFLDGTAELNVGLFWMMMEEFQLFTIGPVEGGFLPVSHVINVGELRARGVEADATWLPTDWLTIRGAVGFNDSEYLDFPIGTCTQDRQDTDGDGDARCDLTGGPLEQAPKWEISTTPSVRLPLASLPGVGGDVPSFLGGIDLTSSLSVQYTDVRFLNDTNDPRTRQPSHFLLDGSLGFANSAQGWSFHVRVENLTDEQTANVAYEALPAGGMIFKAPSPPRLVFGGFRWEF